jgi:hypothetical protein
MPYNYDIKGDIEDSTMQVFEKVMDKDGYIVPKMMAQYFHTVVGDVLEMTGVPESAATRKERMRSSINQSRLLNTLEIINQVKPWAGSDFKAYAWYRSERIPALGDITAEEAVKAGHANAVKLYLNSIALGGFA